MSTNQNSNNYLPELATEETVVALLKFQFSFLFDAIGKDLEEDAMLGCYGQTFFSSIRYFGLYLHSDKS